jgi:hypothetical protein
MTLIVIRSRPHGAVVRTATEISDDPYVEGSNPAEGCRDRSFGKDRVNRGPES